MTTNEINIMLLAFTIGFFTSISLLGWYILIQEKRLKMKFGWHKSEFEI